MPRRTSPSKAVADPKPESWLLFVYRVPSDSSRARVAVWRDLRRLGVLYVQQAVCILPDREELRQSLARVRERIDEFGGWSIFIPVHDVEDEARQQFIEGFSANSAKEYSEIVEECDGKFLKWIEFERFRQNYTVEQAEEIRQDLERLRRSLEKVESHDWMGVPERDIAQAKIAECEARLEQFEADVLAKQR